MASGKPAQLEIPPSFLDYLENRTEIAAAYLFGSLAEGRAHKLSDVDVALLLVKGTDRDTAWDIRLQAMGEAEAAFDRRADVAMLHEVGTLLKFQIVRRGRLIFERDRAARIGFEMQARNEYWDYKPYLDVQYDELKRRIKEKGLGYGHERRARARTKA